MKFKVRSIGLILWLGLAMSSVLLSPAVAGGPYQDVSQEFFDKEKEKWREVIKREPKNATAYLELAKTLDSEAIEGYWSDCSAQTIAVYRQALAVVDPNAAIHFSLGQALMSDASNGNCDEYYLGDETQVQARKKEGLSHLLKATLIDQSQDDYFIALGSALQEKGELDAAIVAYKKAIYLEVKPTQNESHLYDSSSHKSTRYSQIGDELWKKADFKAAAAAYQKALAIEPDNSYAQGRLRAVKHKLIRRLILNME